MRPIGFTAIDWQGLAETFQDSMGESPTRYLDEAGIKLSDPTALVRAFQQEIPKEYHPIWDHFYLTILCTEIPDNLPLKAFSVKKGKRSLILVSGSLTEWRDAVVYFSTTDDREWANGVYNLFSASRLAEIWSGYDRVSKPNGTFELCRRHS